MHRAIAITALLVGSILAAASACDASYSSPPLAGALDGPCLANGTCDAPLSCISNVCVELPDAGASVDAAVADATPVDADTNDTGFSDGSSDATPTCGALPPPLDPACYDAGTQVCFVDGEDGARCNTAGPCSEIFNCNGVSGCNGNSACCLMGPASALASGACPGTVYANGANCMAMCGSQNPQLCATSAQCAAGSQCESASVARNLGDAVYATIGVCVVSGP